MSTRTLAITGATGFVGATLLAQALAEGYQVRALTRRPQPPRAGVVWVLGALNQPESLAELVHGADAVIHVAGVVNAPDKSGFVEGNITGTQAMVAAAEAAGIARFVHVSSLAARAPDLSVYGWSKAQAELAVAASALDWVMVRPPWVYGPGDLDTLDLSRLLLALTVPGVARGQILEADDGVSNGWTNKSIAAAIAAAMGRRALVLSTPRTVLRLGAWADHLVRGAKAKLTKDRVRYFCHPDWRIDAQHRPDAKIWTPQIETRTGLKDTAESYRTAGLL